MPNDHWPLTLSPIGLPAGGASAFLPLSTTARGNARLPLAMSRIPASGLARELDCLIAVRGAPTTVVSESGTELTCNATPRDESQN